METLISRLIHFAYQKGMIDEADIDYSVNLLLDLFKLDSFNYVEVDEQLEICTPILDGMLDYAVEKGLIEDTITAKDLFDTRIMNCVMPRPSEVKAKFDAYYKENPKKATKYYYDLSIASNYIRKNRTDKNIGFKKPVKYGNIEITINLSKPEKDPKEIAKAKLVKSSGYPKCLLCKENVGFSGDLNRAARQTHRIIPLVLDGDDYFVQYSPYVYYNEHCIVFNKEHKPMVINKDTFRHLLSFVDLFPHYMLGSNADLPIVGGSILTHDHFQGGSYHFPMEDAEVIQTFALNKYPTLKIDLVRWPLSTVRVSADNKEDIVAFASDLLDAWKQYSNVLVDIISHTDNTPHNTITPIARMKDGKYQMDLVLRNNRTSVEYPDGIFHPHKHLHHIKKENIGLIEVMGLAILPARLKDELALLKECLLGEKNIGDYDVLAKHASWYEELKVNAITKENVDDVVNESLANKFSEVLENAGVFKMDDTGIQAFAEFIKSMDK